METLVPRPLTQVSITAQREGLCAQGAFADCKILQACGCARKGRDRWRNGYRDAEKHCILLDKHRGRSPGKRQ